MAKEIKVVADNTAMVAVSDDYMKDAGIGTEDMSREDMAIPFLHILQQLSPQLNKREGEYVEGAEAGFIFNSVTKGLIDGEKGAIVVPVSFTRNYSEWKPRASGGGFVKDHGNDGSVLDRCETDIATGRSVTQNGTEIVTAGMYYVLLVNPETGAYEQAVISMTSTQLKKSRKWNTLISTLQIPKPNGGGFFTPAMFYMSYKLTSVPESNDKGSWFGWSVERYKPTPALPDGQNVYLAARAFRELIQAGRVKVQPTPQPGTGGDEVPF